MLCNPLAMHMSNELLREHIAAGTIVLAATAVWIAAGCVRRRLDPEKIPLMGVMGAFVFAAQMINFSLPGMPGVSGHLGGAVLLAILLGPAAAIVTTAAILIIQCLLFQDGGLLALGCNIINIGVVPCLLGSYVYRWALGPAGKARLWRQYLAAWAACLVGVTAGAALVPIEAGISGVLRIPVATFLAVMLGVHLIIGFIEGLITFVVLTYLRRVRPAVLGLSPAGEATGHMFSKKAVTVSLLITSLLLAGLVSWFASSHPDGLEWSLLPSTYGQSGPVIQQASPQASEPPAARTWPNVDGWGSLAGIVGTLATLGVVFALARWLRKRRPVPAGV